MMEEKKLDKDINVRSKKILANRVYSDTTLKSWTKEDLIEHIRILEHNWASAEENYNNSVKNSEKIFYEQKTEIERLTEEREKYQTKWHRAYMNELNLQKQVYELMRDKGFLIAERTHIEEQAVKETAKEILGKLDLFFKGTTFRKGYEFKKIDKKLKEMAKSHGVEVE